MQDKYVGDVGDFGKFLILRQVQRLAGRQLCLGVNWYTVTLPEPGSKDGRHVEYQDDRRDDAPRFMVCDPELRHALSRLVGENRRRISDLERANILSGSALYFSDSIPYGAFPLDLRIEQRTRWFEKSRKSLQAAQVVFLNPDNGVQTSKIKKTQTRSVKYAFADEIKGYFEDGKMVIVYNHRDHSPIETYATRFRETLNHVGRTARLRVLPFGSFSARDYAFFYRDSQALLVNDLFKKLTAGPSDFLFSETGVPGL